MKCAKCGKKLEFLRYDLVEVYKPCVICEVEEPEELGNNGEPLPPNYCEDREDR